MTRSDAAAIKDMLIKKIGTMSSLLITTDAGDVIVGGEALRQSVIRFQEITGSEDVMALLLVQINAIVADSTHPLARDFDAKGWLENWVRMPQPGLAGATPVELIRTEDGLAAVQRLLSSSVSGAYL